MRTPVNDRPRARLHGLDASALKDALVLVAFPTTGSAGPIAAQFLQRHLSLPLVGDVRIEGLTQLVAIMQGVASSPVRVYGGQVACGLEGGCPSLYVVTADIPLPPEMVHATARAVLKAARDGGAKLLVCLEGVVRQNGDGDPDVYVAGADAASLDTIVRHTGLPRTARALISGMTGELLLAADGLPTGALVVEAAKDHPDGRAAAALVRGLDKLIPEIDLDAGPLLQEAEELEGQIAATQQQVGRGPLGGHTFI